MKFYHWQLSTAQGLYWLQSVDCSTCEIPVGTVDPIGWIEWVSRQPWATPGAIIELQYLLTPEDERTEACAA